MTISDLSSHQHANIQPNNLEQTHTLQSEEKPQKISNTRVVEELTETESGDPTLLIIKRLAEKYNFTLDDIEDVIVSGVHTTTSRIVQSSYEPPTLDRDNKPIKTKENSIETWQHDRTLKNYVKIPFQYSITFKKRGINNKTIEQKTIQFKQPRYTDIEIKNDFTPHEKSRFEKKIMSIMVGVREEIRSATLQKKRAKIEQLLQQHTSRFSFSHGSSQYLYGKKLSPLLKKDPSRTAEGKSHVVGVYLAKNNLFNRTIQHLSPPISIEINSQTYDDEQAIGRTHIGYIHSPHLQRIEEYRNRYRELAISISKNEKQEEQKWKELHSLLDQQRSSLGDLNTILQLEARSAVELMSEIDEFMKTQCMFTQENTLDEKSKFIKLLQFESNNISKNLDDITQGLAKLPEEIKNQYKITSRKDLSQTLSNQLQRQSDSLVRQFHKMSKLNNEETCKDIETNLKKISELKNITDIYLHTQILNTNYNQRKKIAYSWLYKTIKALEGHCAMVAIHEEIRNSRSRERERHLEYLHDAQNKFEYTSMKERIKAIVEEIKKSNTFTL